MKILHVYRTYYPDTQGGIEAMIHQLCTTLQRQKPIEQRLFTLSRNSAPVPIEQPGLQVFQYPLTFEIASCGVSLTALEGFRALADWADIIHYHFPWPFADLLHLLAASDKPALLTYHSDIVRQRRWMFLYAPLMHRFLRRMDTIVTTSPNYLASSPVLQRYRDRTVVIPIGIDHEEELHPDEKMTTSLQRRYGSHFILFIGVLRYYKGLDTLLEAALQTDIPLVIAGRGPQQQSLQRRVAQARGNNIHLAGAVTDAEKQALIALSAAVVLPSNLRSEAFGVVLLEAAAHARALISTELGTGTSYINQDGETGYVVPPNDSGALRSAMQRLIADPEQAKRLGLAARRRLDNQFRASDIAERYWEQYQAILHP